MTWQDEPMPPNILVDLRCVANGECDGTESQTWAKNLLKTDPREFHAQLIGLEKQHQAVLAKWMQSQPVEPKEKPEEPAARDAGRERCDLAIQRLLDEAKEGL
jgi:hypothetical protein